MKSTVLIAFMIHHVKWRLHSSVQTFILTYSRRSVEKHIYELKVIINDLTASLHFH